jgi:putative ABC transport system permease protein
MFSAFVWKMAWRDSRRNRARLFLFIAAVTVGIAALTAVRSFSVNLQKDIDREAKTLLGADLSLDARQPIPDSLLRHFQPEGTESARVVSFITMVRFPKNGGTRLVQVRALEGRFPFYGTWKTEPLNAAAALQTDAAALAEHALMLQFNLAAGDSVQVGDLTLPIAGDLLSSTGRAGIASSIAPVLYIPLRLLQATELVQRGSRVDYQYFFKLPPDTDLKQLIEPRKKQMEADNIDWSTVESRKENIGAAFGNMGMFLNLTGFIALLLGCIGVAGAVHIYIKDKLPTVAILRCLGASGRRAFYIYLLQVSGIGLLGAVAGAVLGSLIQKVMPLLLRDLLPLEEVSTDLSPAAALQGVLLGMTVAVLFALLPLSGILRTSPLRTLRASFDTEEGTENRGLRYGVYALIAIAMFLFTWSLTQNVQWAGAFLGGIAVAFGVLYLLARVLTALLRRFFPRGWKYVWRQGIANLFRPQNQTLLLLVTIGLGTMLLSTLFLVRNMLLKQVEFAGANEQPNMVLFDIQTKDRDSVAALTRRYDLPVLQQVPIVTCRIETIGGRTRAQDEVDSLQALPRWVWDREYRVTFRDTLIETEKITAGTWKGHYQPGSGPVPVSISDGLQKAARLQPGDRLVFNVQGARLECEVGSVREVNFSRIQTNFLVVFPQGVLEAAPQFHVLVTRVNSAETSARFQSDLVMRFPGISAIDLTQILKSVDEVLKKVSFVIRFMAFFSILTGMLVLLSSIYQNKYARVRESVLLRTLGASRRQILQINSVEYLLLGTLACLTGAGLSVAGAWALARFAFQMPFRPDVLPLLLIFASITVLTLLIGLFNSRQVVTQPPLEVLRAESS